MNHYLRRKHSEIDELDTFIKETEFRIVNAPPDPFLAKQQQRKRVKHDTAFETPANAFNLESLLPSTPKHVSTIDLLSELKQERKGTPCGNDDEDAFVHACSKTHPWYAVVCLLVHDQLTVRLCKL